MFRKLYPWMFLLGGVLIGMVASGRVVLLAQDRGQSPANSTTHRFSRSPATDPVSEEAGSPASPATIPASREPARGGLGSVQDVLLRPYHFPFNRPTTLSQVCLHLKQTLGVPVVLDIAALGRQGVEPADTVQLELDGVRLRTGLKLLLDQVGLTYQVVPDDNLLILTDREGSDDPMDRVWTELKALHRDLHDVQDAVDELTDAIYGGEEEGPHVRKPTIIEEKPDRDPLAPEGPAGENKDPKAPPGEPGTTRPRSRSGGSAPPSSPRTDRPSPSRIPL